MPTRQRWGCPGALSCSPAGGRRPLREPGPVCRLRAKRQPPCSQGEFREPRVPQSLWPGQSQGCPQLWRPAPHTQTVGGTLQAGAPRPGAPTQGGTTPSKGCRDPELCTAPTPQPLSTPNPSARGGSMAPGLPQPQGSGLSPQASAVVVRDHRSARSSRQVLRRAEGESGRAEGCWGGSGVAGACWRWQGGDGSWMGSSRARCPWGTSRLRTGQAGWCGPGQAGRGRGGSTGGASRAPPPGSPSSWAVPG